MKRHNKPSNAANKMSTFPVLFGDSSHGKRKMWSVSVEARGSTGVIITTHGYEDGKKVVNERIVSVGKNIGKKNETTPLQQAQSEAESLWNKKHDSGYAEDGPKSSSAAVAPVEIPLPMLAHDYNKRGKDIKFPCYAQRKLDGVRCVAIPGKGLYSRNGKAMSPHLTHIMADVNKCSVTLDGELYSDELSFQEIVGLVKKATLKDGDAEKVKKIYLYVYDIVMPGTNKERKAAIETLFGHTKFHALRPLESETCANLDAVKTLHAKYVAEGYEGLILRNYDGAYNVGHRSKDLQKYKEFEDSEYAVIGFREGDGVEKGCVIWTCVTAKGQEFAVRPRGTQEERRSLYQTGAAYVGKKLTVRYQELTNDGIPRFPVGIAFRDYE
jgi:DNA ligase-1